MFSVYRAFDATGQLLYIGSTADFFRRMQDHHAKAKWMTTQVARIDITWFDTLDAARLEESRAVHDEHPLYNRHLQERKHGPEDRLCPHCKVNQRPTGQAYCSPCAKKYQAAYRLARKGGV